MIQVILMKKPLKTLLAAGTVVLAVASSGCGKKASAPTTNNPLQAGKPYNVIFDIITTLGTNTVKFPVCTNTITPSLDQASDVPHSTTNGTHISFGFGNQVSAFTALPDTNDSVISNR
jgi:hypothetical protein